MNRLSKSHRPKANLKILIPLAVAVVIVSGIVLYSIFYKTSPTPLNVQHANSTAHQTAAPNTVVTNPPPTPTTKVTGGSTGESDTSNASLTAPSGTFVSNHGNLSAYPVTSGTTESSTCSTAPGATCYIKFTNTQTGAVEQLSLQHTTNTGTEKQPPGTVSWIWTPSQEYLSPGNWTIVAVAALAGQTKSTTDTTSLTVSP